MILTWFLFHIITIYILYENSKIYVKNLLKKYLLPSFKYMKITF